MSEQLNYLRSLKEAKDLPVKQSAVIADLIDNLDSLPGAILRHKGEEIWISTAGQVEGWLSEFMNAYMDVQS